MVYLVTTQTPIAGVTKKHVIAKGFACTRGELLQEIATHLGVKKISIVDVAMYSTREAAETVARHC